jgi:hypothetical protein
MALGRLGVGFPSDLVARPFAFSHFCPEAGTHCYAWQAFFFFHWQPSVVPRNEID